MVRIRRVDLSQDGAGLFELVRKCGTTRLFPHQPNFLNLDQFQQWLADRLCNFFHDLYIIEGVSNDRAGEIEGILLAYDYRTYDGHCQVYGYLQQGMTCSVMAQFLEILFRNYPLNKVFLEATEFDQPLLSVAREIGFKQEAVLSEECFRLGAYRDLYVMSYYRQKG